MPFQPPGSVSLAPAAIETDAADVGPGGLAFLADGRVARRLTPAELANVDLAGRGISPDQPVFEVHNGTDFVGPEVIEGKVRRASPLVAL